MSEKNDVVEIYRQVMQQRCLDIARYFTDEAGKWDKCVKPDHADAEKCKGISEGLRQAATYMEQRRESISSPKEFETSSLSRHFSWAAQ